MKQKSYTVVYVPAAMNGEQGYDYEVIVRGRIVLGGWSRGKKHHAEQQVREAIRAREALRGLSGLEVA